MCFNCRRSALIWGYLHPNQVNGVGITTVLHMCLPLVKGPKVMGQIIIIIKLSLFNTWLQILCSQYSLKSGTLDITRRWVSSLVMLCQASTATVFSSCLSWGIFLQFCLQQVKCMLNRIQVRWLTWPLHNSSLLSLQKTLWLLLQYALGHCPSALWSTVQWVLKDLCWIWADNCPKHFRIHSCCFCQQSHHQ